MKVDKNIKKSKIVLEMFGKKYEVGKNKDSFKKGLSFDDLMNSLKKGSRENLISNNCI